MTSQPPMFDPIGQSLPGPQFTPRPGWGGQLRKWYVENVYGIIFRLVMLCALALLGAALLVHRERTNTTPIENIALRPITLSALPGDGMTNLTARAIDLYIAVQPNIIQLDASQHLYAVDALARKSCWCPLEINQNFMFDIRTISDVVDSALLLSPTQKAAWSRLLQ